MPCRDAYGANIPTAGSMLVQKVTANLHILLCLMVFLAACTGRSDAELPDHLAEFENVTVIPADATPQKTVRLLKQWEIGPDGDVLMDQLYALATDEHGNMYISGGDKIHLYDPEGNYRQSIGQHGTGPGDLISVFDIQIVDNALFALDFSQIRIQLFSTTSLGPDGMILLDIRTLPHVENVIPPHPLTFRVDDDRSFLIGFQISDPAEPALQFYRFDSDGSLVSDSLLSLLLIETLPMPGTPHFIPSPVANRGLFQIGPDNRIYTASTKEFFIKIHSPDGSYQSAMYHPIEKRELRARDAMEAAYSDVQRQALAASTLPEYWPLLRDMVVDDEKRIWVSVDTGDAGTLDWRVLDEHGNLLALFMLPENRKILKIRDHHLYALETDEETGLETVLKYEVVFEPKR